LFASGKINGALLQLTLSASCRKTKDSSRIRYIIYETVAMNTGLYCSGGTQMDKHLKLNGNNVTYWATG